MSTAPSAVAGAGAASGAAGAAAPVAGKPKRFCNDRDAVNFWNAIAKSQPKKTELDIGVFSDGLARHFEKEYPSTVIHNIVENFILYDGAQTITVERYLDFVAVWGPFVRCVDRISASLLDPTGQVQRWFHGKVSRDDAHKLLTKQNLFLLRLSDTNPGKLSLHCTVLKEHAMKLKIIVISPVAQGFECVLHQNEKARVFPTLLKLLQEEYISFTPVTCRRWKEDNPGVDEDKTINNAWMPYLKPKMSLGGVVGSPNSAAAVAAAGAGAGVEGGAAGGAVASGSVAGTGGVQFVSWTEHRNRGAAGAAAVQNYVPQGFAETGGHDRLNTTGGGAGGGGFHTSSGGDGSATQMPFGTSELLLANAAAAAAANGGAHHHAATSNYQPIFRFPLVNGVPAGMTGATGVTGAITGMMTGGLMAGNTTLTGGAGAGAAGANAAAAVAAAAAAAQQQAVLTAAHAAHQQALAAATLAAEQAAAAGTGVGRYSSQTSVVNGLAGLTLAAAQAQAQAQAPAAVSPNHAAATGATTGAATSPIALEHRTSDALTVAAGQPQQPEGGVGSGRRLNPS